MPRELRVGHRTIVGVFSTSRLIRDGLFTYSSGLLCKGEEAKQVFLEVGGLEALLQVASSANDLKVLVPVCNSLLNLSSYVPIQVGKTLKRTISAP